MNTVDGENRNVPGGPAHWARWPLLLTPLGIVLLLLALVVPLPRDADRAGLRQGGVHRDGGAVAPLADFGGLPQSTIGTVLSDVRALGGPVDLSGQIGDHMEISIDAAHRVNDVAFWGGARADGILVVVGRDTRSGVEKQLGLPSESGLTPPPRGIVTVRGTVEPLPYAEAMYSWGLTRRDAGLLAERGVYVRVREVVSAAPGTASPLTAEDVDEYNRETAPPPGEQVNTPLNLPPPRP